MNTIKQNIALFVGLVIPVVMMLVIAGVIYLPRMLSPITPPQHDFLYAVGDGVVYATPYGAYPTPYAYPYPSKGVWPKYIYRVVDGKLARTDAGPVPKEYGTMPVEDIAPKFYVHHVATDTNTPVTFEEAATYSVDSGAKSPDGFDIVRGQGGGGDFLFSYGGNNYNKQYLHKDHYAEELNLNLPENYYGDFFVAWIVKDNK